MNETAIYLAISNSVTVILTTLINYFLFFPKMKGEVKKLDSDVHKSDVDTAKSEIELVKSEAELVEFERKLIADARTAKTELDTERENRRLDNHYHERDRKRLSDELEDLRERFFRLGDQIAGIRESEADCKTRLIEVESSVAKMQADGQITQNKLKEYSDRAAQLTALVKKAHKQGFLSDNEVAITDA